MGGWDELGRVGRSWEELGKGVLLFPVCEFWVGRCCQTIGRLAGLEESGVSCPLGYQGRKAICCDCWCYWSCYCCLLFFFHTIFPSSSWIAVLYDTTTSCGPPPSALVCTRKISKAIYTILLVRFARFFIYIRHVILSFTSRERPFTISIHTPHSLLHYVQWPLDPTGPTHASLVVARIGTELPLPLPPSHAGTTSVRSTVSQRGG